MSSGHNIGNTHGPDEILATGKCLVPKEDGIHLPLRDMDARYPAA